MGPIEDKTISNQLKKGDKEALREAYTKYHTQLYGVAVKYLKSKNLAEDAVHDVFIKLWNHRQKLDTQKSLKGFLFTSMKNHVLNMIRNHKRDVEKNMSYALLRPVSQNKTESELTLKNYKKVFEDALQELPEGKREVFDLKMKSGLSNKKIAEKLDVSVNTVKSQYYKASRFIKGYLSEHTDLELS